MFLPLREEGMDRLREKLGVCQWFHFEAHEDLERAVDELKALGVKHLRTGISWADYHRPGGKAWYDWQMRRLRDFEILLSVWHTPPSISEGGLCAHPPKRLQDYADFIWLCIEQYGHRFADLELWNEPNNKYKWAFETHDPQWQKFGKMTAMAANTARMMGKRTVLGGMIPVDHHWLGLMEQHGALDFIDVVAIHAFPGMWWSHAPNWEWHRDWRGWEDKLGYIGGHSGGRPIWVSETGLATWKAEETERDLEQEQCVRLVEAAAAPSPRIYWYNLIDLDPRREAIEGFHVDENEYHLGLVEYGGRRKPAWSVMKRLLAEERLAPAQASQSGPHSGSM
jgi:CDP-paratose 2-epimerase